MAGKGDKPRPYNYRAYAESYSRIFGDKPKRTDSQPEEVQIRETGRDAAGVQEGERDATAHATDLPPDC